MATAGCRTWKRAAVWPRPLERAPFLGSVPPSCASRSSSPRGRLRWRPAVSNSATRVACGHEVTPHHPEGTAPAGSFTGRAGRALTAAATEESDVALCADPHTFGSFRAHRSGSTFILRHRGRRGARARDRRSGVTLPRTSGALWRSWLPRSAPGWPCRRRRYPHRAHRLRRSAAKRSPPLQACSERLGARARKKGTGPRSCASCRPATAPFEVVAVRQRDAQQPPGPARRRAAKPPNARLRHRVRRRTIARAHQSSRVVSMAGAQVGMAQQGCSEAAARPLRGRASRSARLRSCTSGTRRLVPAPSVLLRRAIRRVLTDDALRERAVRPRVWRAPPSRGPRRCWRRSCRRSERGCRAAPP